MREFVLRDWCNGTIFHVDIDVVIIDNQEYIPRYPYIKRLYIHSRDYKQLRPWQQNHYKQDTNKNTNKDTNKDYYIAKREYAQRKGRRLLKTYNLLGTIV